MQTSKSSRFGTAPAHAARFPRRVLAQLRLALLADCGCQRTLAALDLGARQAGLTGAEIDAALAGRSFDARTDATLRYAFAIKTGAAEQVAMAKAKALRLGVSDEELQAVSLEVAAVLGGGAQ